MSLSGTRVGREKRCAEGERPEDCLSGKTRRLRVLQRVPLTEWSESLQRVRDEARAGHPALGLGRWRKGWRREPQTGINFAERSNTSRRSGVPARAGGTLSYLV